MTVGIVVVSHSRALAEAAVALAAEMLHGREAGIEVAAGLDDGAFGTDAVAIVDAIARADRGDGVVVLMDLGSAVLSAELALDLMSDEDRERVVLCAAPLVEGLIVAAVAADSGADAAEVAGEATAALAAKQSHLGPADDLAPGPADGRGGPDVGELIGTFTVGMPHGLHARPAALLVQTLRGFDAVATLRNRTLDGPPVPAGSMSKVATLGALRGHEVEVRVSGPQAAQALQSLLELARTGFGEGAGSTPAAPVRPATTRRGKPMPASPGIGIGPACPLREAGVTVPDEEEGDADTRWQRLQDALGAVRRDVQLVREQALRQVGAAEAAIFDAHLLLLDDPDLVATTRARIASGAGAARAWADGLDEVEAAFVAMPDGYLQARAADVRDVRDQVLRHLGGTAGASTDVDGVLVAADLTPAQAAALDPAPDRGGRAGPGQPHRAQRDPAAGPRDPGRRRRRPRRAGHRGGHPGRGGRGHGGDRARPG